MMSMKTKQLEGNDQLVLMCRVGRESRRCPHYERQRVIEDGWSVKSSKGENRQ